MNPAPLRAPGERPDIHPGRRLLAMLVNIAAKACFIVGALWTVLVTPMLTGWPHAEALAESAECLAVGACLWHLAERLCPRPWGVAPARAADREGRG